MIERSWLTHESPGLEPDWLSDVKLFFVKKSNIVSYGAMA